MNSNNRLYVANISFQSTKDDLFDFFTRVGNVIEVIFINDRETRKFRGFGFVDMGTEEDANNAIEKLNGVEFMGRPLVVRKANPRKSPQEMAFGDNNR